MNRFGASHGFVFASGDKFPTSGEQQHDQKTCRAVSDRKRGASCVVRSSTKKPMQLSGANPRANPMTLFPMMSRFLGHPQTEVRSKWLRSGRRLPSPQCLAEADWCHRVRILMCSHLPCAYRFLQDSSPAAALTALRGGNSPKQAREYRHRGRKIDGKTAIENCRRNPPRISDARKTK